jgi:transposase
MAEQGIEVSPRTARRVMSEWKRRRREVAVPLHYVAGDLAEVDFFEVQVDVDGKRRKAWMFLMRLMYSGRDFAWVYAHQDQACFLDGHVRAFSHFGAVPHRLVYDNLKAAVRRLLVGSERELQVRFEALASHYLFEPNFARPRRGSDKGGVEARGKGVRWQHLSPIPVARIVRRGLGPSGPGRGLRPPGR